MKNLTYNNIIITIICPTLNLLFLKIKKCDLLNLFSMIFKLFIIA